MFSRNTKKIVHIAYIYIQIIFTITSTFNSNYIRIDLQVKP